jgi:hypothetical protein
MFRLQSSFLDSNRLTTTADMIWIFIEGLQPTAAGFLRPIYPANLTSASARALAIPMHIHNNLLSKSTQKSILPIRSPRRGLYTDSGEPSFIASIFPPGWEGGRHPDDLKTLSAPVRPEIVLVRSEHGSAMWFRTSFKMSNGFVSSSFLIYTGAPEGLYMNES